MDVWYKDPCVVHLPNGQGWLMLLTRVRKVRNVEPDFIPCGAEDFGAAGPDDCPETLPRCTT